MSTSAIWNSSPTSAASSSCRAWRQAGPRKQPVEFFNPLATHFIANVYNLTTDLEVPIKTGELEDLDKEM